MPYRQYLESLSRERRKVRLTEEGERTVFPSTSHSFSMDTGENPASAMQKKALICFSHIWSFTFPEVESRLKIYRAAIDPLWLHSSSLMSCGSKTVCK